MTMFAIGFLAIAGLIPAIVKLDKAEKEFSQVINKEHGKTVQGIARYNTMKNRPK